MLYTKEAVKRIIGQKTGCICTVESLDVWHKVARVTYSIGKKKVSTFISKAEFRLDFIRVRKIAARSYQVRNRADSRYTVIGYQSAYVLNPKSNTIECGCEDYKRQQQVLGRGCCKHGYALLSYLGYQSLAEYNLIKKVS